MPKRPYLMDLALMSMLNPSIVFFCVPLTMPLQVDNSVSSQPVCGPANYGSSLIQSGAAAKAHWIFCKLVKYDYL